MGSFINDIDISISVGTLSASGRSFDPLIMSIASSGSGIDIGSATTLTEVTALGYQITDPEYLMASAMLSQDTPPSLIKIYRAPATASGIAAAASTIILTDDSWYHLLITSRLAADLNAAGTWALANKKRFTGCSSDLAALTNRNNKREFYIMHTTPTDYPDAAEVGKLCSKTPGSVNWKWKVLAGLTAGTWTQSQLQTIRAAKCAALQAQSGVTFVNDGHATDGTPVQQTEGQDYIEDQMRVELLNVFINHDNVALDAEGIDLIEGSVRNTLHRMGQLGLIQTVDGSVPADMDLSDDKVYKYYVQVPSYSDLSSSDKSAGSLNGVKFVYYPANGINGLGITGLITL